MASICSLPVNTVGRWQRSKSSQEKRKYSIGQISVSDGTDSVTLAPFTITVNGLPNQPPTIGGTPPAEAMIDMLYDFTPIADDPDNLPLPLSFSISGQPSWANFDPSTGRLWGTPVSGDERTYSGIGISVWDGIDFASLPDFEIAVVAQTLGSANLSWDAPTKNTDGTDLSDLAGFYIHYGPAVDDYPNVVRIDNPTVTTHLVENLSPGTWIFVVTAFNTSEIESEYSNYASYTISP